MYENKQKAGLPEQPDKEEHFHYGKAAAWPKSAALRLCE
jgi:hypothetical protein